MYFVQISAKFVVQLNLCRMVVDACIILHLEHTLLLAAAHAIPSTQYPRLQWLHAVGRWWVARCHNGYLMNNRNPYSYKQHLRRYVILSVIYLSVPIFPTSALFSCKGALYCLLPTHSQCHALSLTCTIMHVFLPPPHSITNSAAYIILNYFESWLECNKHFRKKNVRKLRLYRFLSVLDFCIHDLWKL